jgi:hypothetical protein
MQEVMMVTGWPEEWNGPNGSTGGYNELQAMGYMNFRPGELSIGCPTSDVAQRAMREAAPHARGVSKARQL